MHIGKTYFCVVTGCDRNASIVTSENQVTICVLNSYHALNMCEELVDEYTYSSADNIIPILTSPISELHPP